MLSRRNVRIKVMQSLYQVEIKELKQTEEAERILRQLIHKSTDLFNYLIYFLVEITRYAETDATSRANKNIVTSADLQVNKKLLENTVIEKITASPPYRDCIEGKVKAFEDTEKHVKRIYQNMLKSPAFLLYVEDNGADRSADRDIIAFIYNDLMDADEQFNLHIAEHFPNWEDEYESIQLLVMHFLNKAYAFNLTELLGEVKWQYACELIKAVMTKKDILTEHIISRLRNWEPERIALIDMIILQMGVAEFLFFETIPPKVTINEYIDLAKAYSTTQSGQFINGVLDSIHKDLIRNNKMHKVETH